MSQTFDIPVDVPWSLVAASPDMMDTTFCDGGFPPTWQSSLAIYAYEPSPNDLPQQLCNQRITYLKVTCSITGFQPSKAEVDALNAIPPPATQIDTVGLGAASAGTVRLTFVKGATSITTAPIFFNATTAAVQTAVNTAIGVGNCMVSGGGSWPAALTFTFSGSYANAPITVTGKATGLTGGTITITPITPAVDVTVPLPTVPADVAENLISDYYACYGVLLNVAVFPSTTTILKGPPVHHNDGFAGAKGPLGSPYTDPQGIIFALENGALLQIKPVPPPSAGPQALDIFGDKMTITLPESTNVVLKIWANSDVTGTVTAFWNGAQVFTAPLVSTAGVQDFPILPSSNSPVTSVVIDPVTGECLLAGLTYDTQAEQPVQLGDYPHIIDFEPKTRDLYQAATDQNEILTASNSNVNAGKSLTNTSSSEMGLGLSGGYGSGNGAGGNATASMTGKWGNTTADGSTTQIDQSRERRETQGSTTNITQQYNLLTGYHAGTNRAAFLMLPRPHTLQATDYRTFVRGLRMIEGIQEFFLIVSRPAALPGICIETSLETGHFPEDVALKPPPPPKLVHQAFPFTITALAPGGDAIGHSFDTSQSFALDPGWTIDPTQGDPGTPGLSIQINPTPPDTIHSIEFIQALMSKVVTATVTHDAVAVKVHISSGNFFSPPPFYESAAACNFMFTVYGIEVQPPPIDIEPVVISPFLVTSRDLCVCINSGVSDDCISIGPLVESGGDPGKASSTRAGDSIAAPAAISARLAAFAKTVGRKKPAANTAKTPPSSAGGPEPAKPGKETVNSSIVYETKLKLPHHLLHSTQLQKSRTPAARELMYQIQHHMLANSRHPRRRPHGAVGFADSDYVCEHLAHHLPKAYLARHIADVKDLPKGVVRALGAKTTIGDVLSLELHRLCTRAKVGLEEAIDVRRALLGLGDKNVNGKK